MKLNSVKSSLGLTLIELLITMLIVIILIAIGIPSYQKFIQTERFAVATNNLYQAYRFARSEAIKKSSPMTLLASDGVWGNGWHVQDSSAAVLFVSKTPHASINISGNAITVLGMGSISGGSATFTISDTNKTRHICVLSSGQSVLQDGGC